MNVRSGAAHIRDALSAWLTADSSARLVGESVGRGGGTAGTTAGLLASHPAQVLDTPVGDRSVAGLALGLATGGVPVCAELSSTRGLLAAAAVLVDAARLASTEFRPSLVIRVPVHERLGAQLAPAVGDLFARLPGVGVHVVRAETAHGVLTACLEGGVHVVLEPASEHARNAEALPVHLGRSITVEQGAHATVVAYGEGVLAARQASEALRAEGIQIDVIDAVTLSTVDPAIGEQVCATGRIVAVHTDDESFSDRLLAFALRSAFLYLESPPSGCRAEVHSVTEAVRQSVHY